MSTTKKTNQGKIITSELVSPSIIVDSSTGDMILKTAADLDGSPVNLSGLRIEAPFYVKDSNNTNVLNVTNSSVYINDLHFDGSWIKNTSDTSLTICSSDAVWNSPSFSMYPQVTDDTNSGYVIIRGGGSKVTDASYNTIHTKTNFPDTYSLKGNFSLYKQHRVVISNSGSLYFETVYKKINDDTNEDTESYSETSKHLVRSVNGKTANSAGNVDVDITYENKKVFTSSSSFTAPKSGLYFFQIMGGGYAGGKATGDNGGRGGNCGKFMCFSYNVAKDTIITVTVGASSGGASAVKIGNIKLTSEFGISQGSGGAGSVTESKKAGSNGTTVLGGTAGTGGSASNYVAATAGGGGAGGWVIPGLTIPKASAGVKGHSNAGNAGTGGTGFGAGGGGGSSFGDSNVGAGGDGANGVVVIYY